MKKPHYTLREFIKRSQTPHGNRYDYSNTIYIDSKTKVEIICKKHGAFWQEPSSHMRGHGCPICGVDNRTKKNKIIAKNKKKELKYKGYIPKDCIAIPLSKGKYSIVDKKCIYFINQYNWAYSRYAKATVEKRSVLLHRIIAEAFIPNPENKPCVNHINGVKTDNRIENLEWCTHKENTRHAVDTGLIKNLSGDKCTYTKIKDEEVLDVFKRANNGELIKDIANYYAVDPSTISKILAGKTRKSVIDRYGLKFTGNRDVWRSNMSKRKRKPSTHLNKIIIDIQTGVYYESITEARELYNIPQATLSRWLNNTALNKTSLRYA